MKTLIKYNWFFLWFGTIIIAYFILSSMTIGCVPVCEYDTTSCDGSLVRICNADEQWQTIMNCDEVSSVANEPFVCCLVEFEGIEGIEGIEGVKELIHACVPESECKGELL